MPPTVMSAELNVPVYREQADGGIRIPLALTQDDLASWIGASREAVSKALRPARTRGWIETGRRTVLILDLAALCNWALQPLAARKSQI
jgi:CRP-like cAMP-binding protein